MRVHAAVFESWGRFAFRHRRLVPFVIVACVALLYAIAGTSLGSKLSQEGWSDPGADSTVARDLENSTFGRDNRGDIVLLFTAQPGHRIDEPAAVGGIAAHLQVLKAAHPDQIDSVTSFSDKQAPFLATKDYRTAITAIGLKGTGE